MMTNETEKQGNTLESSAKNSYVKQNKSLLETFNNFLYRILPYSESKKDLLCSPKSNFTHSNTSFYRTFI